MTPAFLTAREVAKLLKLNVETVYALAHKGEIPGTKIGGQWRFLEADLTQWFRTQTQQQRTQAHT